MAKSKIRIGLVQQDIAWENPNKNLLKLDNLLSESTEADIIVLPEMFTTGFTMNALAMAEPMNGRAVTWMQEISNRLGIDLVGSLIIQDGDQYYNRVIWMSPLGIKGTYDKHQLFGMAGEDRVFTAGTQHTFIPYNDWQCCPFICYDVRFPLWCRVGKKADLMIFMANFPEKRISAWTQLLKARAIENQCYVIGVNRVGWDGEGHFYNGASAVYDPMGETIVRLKDDVESVAYVTLDGISQEIVRRDLPFLNDADDFTIQTK